MTRPVCTPKTQEIADFLVRGGAPQWAVTDLIRSAMADAMAYAVADRATDLTESNGRR